MLLIIEAYFVSRNEVLAWIQDFFQLPYDRVEQAGTGAFACQVLDSIYPGQVPMNRVSFNGKQEYEHIENYKVLQTAFKLFRIEKYIPVDKLIRCKYQDNLEFLQWLHYFWKSNANLEAPYDPIARRAKCKGTRSSSRSKVRYRHISHLVFNPDMYILYTYSTVNYYIFFHFLAFCLIPYRW